MAALYVVLFWNAIFPYDEEVHSRAKFAKDKSEIKATAIKQMQIEYIQEHH
ncbi:hypothetical protein [Cytobacillus depressus]|nr:hypothetical protein [Cytobacillus depressus]